MTPNAQLCIDVVLLHEGKLSMRMDDPGNWTGGAVGVGVLKGTKYGIAAASYPELDIQNLAKATAEVIYDTDFWPQIDGDALPLPLAMVTMDACVMSGAHNSHGKDRAIGWLQKALLVQEDGDVGPVTLSAASVCDAAQIVRAYTAYRLAFLQGLKLWAIDGSGWQNRVLDTQSRALTGVPL